MTPMIVSIMELALRLPEVSRAFPADPRDAAEEEEEEEEERKRGG